MWLSVIEESPTGDIGPLGMSSHEQKNIQSGPKSVISAKDKKTFRRGGELSTVETFFLIVCKALKS